MIIGDLSCWADTFPEALVPRVVDLLVGAWPELPHSDPGEHETQITRRFLPILRHHRLARRLPFSIDREVMVDDGEGAELGRVDLRFMHGFRESVYLVFECKRLNVRQADGRVRSLATPYVTEGMMRFVTSQYAEGLPVGGMLAYVMDSDVARAVAAVEARVGQMKGGLKIHRGRDIPLEISASKNSALGETLHEVAERLLLLRHVFLPVRQTN